MRKKKETTLEPQPSKLSFLHNLPIFPIFQFRERLEIFNSHNSQSRDTFSFSLRPWTSHAVGSNLRQGETRGRRDSEGFRDRGSRYLQACNTPVFVLLMELIIETGEERRPKIHARINPPFQKVDFSTGTSLKKVRVHGDSPIQRGADVCRGCVYRVSWKS